MDKITPHPSRPVLGQLSLMVPHLHRDRDTSHALLRQDAWICVSLSIATILTLVKSRYQKFWAGDQAPLHRDPVKIILDSGI